MKKNLRPIFLLTALLLSFSACDQLNSPYPSSGGYNDPYGGYNNGYGGTTYNRDREYDRQQAKLERERERLREERRQLDAEQDRAREAQRYTPPPPPPRQESCPSGFSPSENRCSSEERRRGCRDIRLPGGLGCVSR